MNIDKINNYSKFLELGEKIKDQGKSELSFSDLFSDALNKVNHMQLESDNYKNLLAIGELDNLHDLTIATEKANTSLQIVMSVRNKIIEAYKEILRIQI